MRQVGLKNNTKLSSINESVEWLLHYSQNHAGFGTNTIVSIKDVDLWKKRLRALRSIIRPKN